MVQVGILEKCEMWFNNLIFKRICFGKTELQSRRQVNQFCRDGS